MNNNENSRFKFRAWDSVLKKMSLFGFDRASQYSECLDTPIMQWTGLVDKNGVEIYESDIVEYCIKVSSRGPKRQTVIYMNYGYISPLNNSFSVDFKVIGNIHQNPELMED